MPPYPYFKIVLVAEQAEVAALPCDGGQTENIVFHADLLSKLYDRNPALESQPFMAGWLTQSAGEAVLHLATAKPVSQEEAERIGCAIGGWCESNEVTKLTISNTSRRSDAEEVASRGWDIEDWIPST